MHTLLSNPIICSYWLIAFLISFLVLNSIEGNYFISFSIFPSSYFSYSAVLWSASAKLTPLFWVFRSLFFLYNLFLLSLATILATDIVSKSWFKLLNSLSEWRYSFASSLNVLIIVWIRYSVIIRFLSAYSLSSWVRESEIPKSLVKADD